MVKVGDKAPEFKTTALVDNQEKKVSLSDFKGKRIVLYFYPKDMTPGCTTQACNIRDNWGEFEKKGIVVIGVSKDSVKSHQNFVSKKGLPFALVADEDLSVNKAYGVWQMKKFMGREFMGTVRTTFLIDENGVIIGIIEKPKVGEHSKEIFEIFNLLC